MDVNLFYPDDLPFILYIKKYKLDQFNGLILCVRNLKLNTVNHTFLEILDLEDYENLMT